MRKGEFVLPENCRGLLSLFLDRDIDRVRQRAISNIQSQRMVQSASPINEAGIKQVATALVNIKAIQKQAQRNRR